jgi:putative flavoprotein involved in K+ transport
VSEQPSLVVGDQKEHAMGESARTPTERVSAWLSEFGAALERGDIVAAVGMFDDDCYWRDLVSFTWNIKTLEGQDAIGAMLSATLDGVRPSGWAIAGEAAEAGGVTEGWFTFETAAARGKGHIRMRGDKCWTLLTTMQELKGFEEPRGATRPRGVEHGVHPGRKNWLEQRAQEAAELGYTTQPYVLILGGGQGGIALGARLKRLGVPTIIVEKNERPGDSWRKRYRSLVLHDPVWYDHLPYLPFPDHWPVFAPKDKIGDWLEMYTKVMELNYWGSTEAKSARYDEERGEWEVTVERNGETLVLRPKQLVFATGMSGVANVPQFAGMDRFKGQQHHSSKHPGGEEFRGKKVVVIGSNNSAHDICADLYEHGADVTMVQRTSTHIARSDTLMELALGGLYSEQAVANGVTTDTADLIFASIPYKIMHEFQIPVYQEMARRDAEFYEQLERAGFLLDWGDDGSGLFMKYLRRGSGYYIDVGASQLIIDGKIKLKSGHGVDRITESGVLLTDGTELPADVIVYATGYGSMNGWVAQLVSPEMAARVGKCWGLGSNTTKDPGPWEGEQRNMWKPTRQDGLWFHGGNLHQSRHYSQFLALQLKARYEDLDTPVYGLAEVYHTA